MENYISLSGTLLTVIADKNVSWSCKTDGNIFLSKYNGVGNDSINIYYSSALPNARIYFITHNDCINNTQILDFPNNNEELNSFYAVPAFINMTEGQSYTITANSQYGVNISSDNKSIILSEDKLDKGNVNFSISGLTNDIDSYVIVTELNTNNKIFIHVNQTIYDKYGFLYIHNQFGKDVTNGLIQWKSDETYFDIITNYPITYISLSKLFNITQINNTHYMAVPKDNTTPCEETITFTNYNGDVAHIILIYQLTISTNMIKILKSSETYYYDYFSSQSNSDYFDSTYQNIGNKFSGDGETYYI